MKKLIRTVAMIALWFSLVTPSFARSVAGQSTQPGSAAQTPTRSHARTKSAKARHHFKKHRKHANNGTGQRMPIKRGPGRAMSVRYGR